MKLQKIFLVAFFLCFIITIPVNAATLNQKLKGRILLQVESRGEAWYINPDDLQSYYMANGDDAFNLMRRFGLGITNKDFDLMKNKFPSKYAGKIFLKVQDSGKAYYINPVDLKPYFLGSANDAYEIMKRLGLGITNKNLEIIKNGNAVNKDESINSACSIKGNINYNTGEKIYHLLNCDYYDDTIIDERYGEKWFCSEQEAINSGWRKASNCSSEDFSEEFVLEQLKNNRIHFILNTKWSQLNNREKSIFMALNNGMNIDEAREELKNNLRSPYADLLNLNTYSSPGSNLKKIEEALYGK